MIICSKGGDPVDVKEFDFLKLVNADHIEKNMFMLMSKDMVAWRKKEVVELAKDAVEHVMAVSNK